MLLHGEIDGERLSDDELLQESLLILVGGDETTRHVISGGMEALIRHPEQRARWRASRRASRGAVEEMLRWVTPIQNMNRTATRTSSCAGSASATGDKLLLLYASANRDESVFEAASASTSPATPTTTSPSAATAPTTVSAPASPASSCA